MAHQHTAAGLGVRLTVHAIALPAVNGCEALNSALLWLLQWANWAFPGPANMQLTMVLLT
jgi:hypothetical protein